MTKHELRRVVQEQLALDLNCTVEQLNGAQDSIVFVPARENPGCRPFARGEHHFEMLTMGGAIVLSATPEIMAIVRPALCGKSRDEAFSMPFVYGHALGYLPDLDVIAPLAAPAGFCYEWVERDGVAALSYHAGFGNAIGMNARRPEVLLLVARRGGEIAGMWQIGMDVLPAHRNHGLAAYLVNALTLEVLRRGRVPYYCASPANIPSQRTAHRAGYAPAWVNSYKGQLEGFELLPVIEGVVA